MISLISDVSLVSVMSDQCGLIGTVSLISGVSLITVMSDQYSLIDSVIILINSVSLITLMSLISDDINRIIVMSYQCCEFELILISVMMDRYGEPGRCCEWTEDCQWREL